MRVDLYELYDDFPTDGFMPLQCSVDLCGNWRCIQAEKLRVSSKGNNGKEACYEYDVSGNVLGTSFVKVPVPEGSSKIDVRFDLLSEDKVIDSFEKYNIRVLKVDEFAPGLPFSSDSMYLRMMGDCSLFSTSDIDSSSVPMYEGTEPPETDEARAYMQGCLEFLSSYRVMDTPVDDEGILWIGTVLDLDEDTPVSMGVLGLCFNIIAQKHGLKPALVMDSGRIFVGVKLAPVDFNRCDMSKNTVIISKASRNAPFVCHTGRYLMAELTGDGDFSKRVESAYKFLSNGFGDDFCIPEMEQEKAALVDGYMMDVVA